MDLALGGAIAGTLRGAGLPREELGVQTAVVAGTPNLLATVSTVTGTYLLRGLPPGSYSLTGFGNGYASQGNSATAAPGAITAGPDFDLQPAQPYISSRYQPQSRTAISGQSSTLSVTAVGQAPLAFQWYLGVPGDTSNPIPGANARDYTTPPVTAAANYWVRVSNGLGATNSQLATVSVAAAGSGGIRGTVTSGSQPVRNTIVNIYSATEQLVASAPATSATGAFSIAGLAPGTYYAFASAGSVSGNVTGSLIAPSEYPYADVLYPNTACAGVHNTGTYCRINTGMATAVSAATSTGGIDFDLPVGGTIQLGSVSHVDRGGGRSGSIVLPVVPGDERQHRLSDWGRDIVELLDSSPDDGHELLGTRQQPRRLGQLDHSDRRGQCRRLRAADRAGRRRERVWRRHGRSVGAARRQSVWRIEPGAGRGNVRTVSGAGEARWGGPTATRSLELSRP